MFINRTPADAIANIFVNYLRLLRISVSVTTHELPNKLDKIDKLYDTNDEVRLCNKF